MAWPSRRSRTNRCIWTSATNSSVTAASPIANATQASHARPVPGRVTATYTGSMPTNTCTVGIRWIANRSTKNSQRPARSLNVG